MKTIFALPMPVVILGRDQHILIMNDAASRILGDDFTGRKFSAVIRQPALLEAIKNAFKNNRVFEATFVQTLAEHDIYYCAHCCPGKNDTIVISFRDDSHRIEMESLRSDFVANVSHELRSPLTAISGFIETLRGSAKGDTTAQARFLDIMARETDRMNRLIEDLLSLARVEADEKIKPDQVIDIASVLSASISLNERNALKYNSRILVDIGEIPPQYTLFGDKDQLQQVFNNLFENAIKYGADNSTVTVKTRIIEPDASLRSNAICICVIDQGDGIENVHIPRLTQRFYRVDEARSRNSGGTGLGLAITKHIINRHRGRLKITSDIGKGSIFSVYLPLEAKEG